VVVRICRVFLDFCGRQAPGNAALRATYTKPFQYSEGIAHVIVNGQVVLDQGKHLGVRPGRALRHHPANKN
jgi:hypothetical protein